MNYTICKKIINNGSVLKNCLLNKTLQFCKRLNLFWDSAKTERTFAHSSPSSNEPVANILNKHSCSTTTPSWSNHEF